MDSDVEVRDDPVYGREEMIPWRCGCCERCWLIVKSEKRKGRCPYGGPYAGWHDMTEES